MFKYRLRKSAILHPTGTCFDDAFEYLEMLLKKDPIYFDENMNSYFLIHAICYNSVKKEDYSHAWVERDYDNTVIEKKIVNNKKPIFIFVEKQEFYNKMKIKEFVRYSMKEVGYFNLKFGTFGPWEQKFLKLCKNYTGLEKYNENSMDTDNLLN